MPEGLRADLQQQIASGDCLLVVGAGVAIFGTGNAPCASWNGLLRHGVQHCANHLPGLPPGWAERASGDIDSGDLDDLLASAEKLSRKLSAPDGGEYARWLRESVGALSMVAGQRELIDALFALGIPIATTNYDSLIEEVCGLPAVTWMDGARVERVLRGDERAVIHLHGHWQRPESVILGIRSYQQILGDAHAQAMLRAIAALRTILFVGCGDGLHDPNFGTLLQWTGAVFAGSEYRRFRLARSSEQAALQREHPPEQRLFVLDYGSDFVDLAPYLRRLRTKDPAAATATPGRAQALPVLPARPRCFGRDEEIAALVTALLAPQPEAVPVLGPPGIGKTNLALTAAHDERVAARYGARRFFVRCDGLQSRFDLAGTIAAALGLPLGGDNEAAALGELGRAAAMLIVDNAETPWEADPLGIEELLARLATLPGLALIVTLRGNERPAGVAWREACRPQPISVAAARELFLFIAGRHFDRDRRLDELLSAIDHVPLAISLLAALAEGEPDLEGLWRRWQDERTAMLQRAGGRDRLTNIELSYEVSWTGPRMTSAGRRLLSLLALLPAGVAHADLGTILPQVATPAAATLRKAGLAFDEAQRLRVLAPLREHVRVRHPPDDADLQRMRSHFIALAAEFGDKLGGAEGGAAAARLLPEAQNIEAMLLGALQDSAATASIAAAIAWAEFVRFVGVGSAAPLEAAATAAERAGDLLVQAKCITSLGDVALQRSDHDDARRRYDEALPLYRQVGDLLGQANCIRSLGDLALQRSDHDDARRRYDEALPLYRQVGDLLGQANCIRSLGDLALQRSDHDDARRRYDEALPLYHQVGDLLGQANCIMSLGNIALQRSDHDDARRRYDEALPLYRQVGDLLGQANCITSLGDLALRRSDHDDARRRYDEALPLYRQVGDLLGQANCIMRLGDVALQRSDHDDARRRFDEALPLYRQVGALLGVGNCQFGSGRAYLAQRMVTPAIAGFRLALESYERFGDPYAIGAAHFFWAQVVAGEEREAHRQAARCSWLGLDRCALLGMAAADGITAGEVEALLRDATGAAGPPAATP